MSEIRELTSAIISLKDEMNNRFDAMDQRFEAVDRRFDEIDQRFDEVDQQFEAVDRRFDKLTLEISEEIQNVVGIINATHNETLEKFNKVDDRLDRIELQRRYCNSDDGIAERLEMVEHEIIKINKKMPALIVT